ncbi:MAG: hypothetical protein OXL96_00230 [Candidatus Poribacteria bacterium]|nr:hypothetical protein [Candidatus Poribacteria bacterium]
MSIVKWTTKYVLYGLLAVVLIVCVGALLMRQRTPKSEPEQKTPEVAEQTPDAEHKTPNDEVLRKRRPVRMNTAARKNPASIGSTHVDHDHPEPFPPLPADALQRRSTHPKLLELVNAGKHREMGDRGPMTLEASQMELEALTGGMNPEDAIDFLEKHGQYNRAILDQVSAHRAFKYLQNIYASWEKVNEYAEKALAEDPDNFEAKAHLILYETDDTKAAAGYREILAKDPNHLGALLNLGYRTHYDDPEGALEHLTKGNKLDPTLGFRAIGLAYERLGDLKTAWLYYRKHLTFWPRDRLALSHLSWIEAGEPKYTPIHLGRQTVAPREEAVIDEEAALPKAQQPSAAQEVPEFPERPSREAHPQTDQPTDAEAARAEYARLQQAAMQEEFDKFIKWAERTMHEDSVRDTDDFLAQELAVHLAGGKSEVAPERLVRAFELMERHGRTNGLRRLKEKDPDLAAAMEQFLKEKRQPPRRRNQQKRNK